MKVDLEQFGISDTVEQIVFSRIEIDIALNADRNGSRMGDTDAEIFDADQPPGAPDDDDLLGGDGNVLIILEDRDPSTPPDDACRGGVIEFNFSKAVGMTSIVVIDIDNLNGGKGGRIEGFAADGGSVGFVDVGPAEDGAVPTFDPRALDDVSRLVITLSGSGAVDDLAFVCCEPEAPHDDRCHKPCVDWRHWC